MRKRGTKGNGAVKGKVVRGDADRQSIQQLLLRPEVRTLAGSVGLDLKRARVAASDLEGERLTDLAASARSVESVLFAADSGALTYSLKIIILLIIVVLLVD